MDASQKQAGVPYSCSRNSEKAQKHRTQKLRRTQGKKEIREARFGHNG